MPRARDVQTAFTAGELDPRLAGRIDVARYYAAGERLRNVLVRGLGGAHRRPGLRHITTIADAGPGIRLIAFAFNVEQTYLLVFTAGTIRVFLPNGAHTATITPTPWTAAQVNEIKWVQSADTLIVFHPDVAPHRLVRTGSHAAWSLSAITFSNVPTFDFGSGPEPVISAARGWPECGTFYQGRLYLGGLRSRPATLLASKVGDFFNLDKGTALDDEALDLTIDTNQVNAIWHLPVTRSLHVFTSGAEHVLAGDGVITPKTARFEEQTRRGALRHVPVAEIDGALLFVQKGGRAVRQHLYDEIEGAFSNTLLSLLSEHLIRTPVDLAARKGNTADADDYLLVVNADGTVAVLTTLRAQEVVAWTLWETDGAVRRVAVLDSGEAFFAVQRAGTTRIESWDEALYVDAGVRVTTGLPADTVTGLGHLDGRDVAVRIDGATHPPRVVQAGQITLERPAEHEVQIGLPFLPLVRTMPAEPAPKSGLPAISGVARIPRVTVRVHDSAPFLLDGRQITMRRFADAPASPLDAPPPRLSGDFRLSGFAGWRRRAQIEVSQPDPQPFAVLALVYDIVW
jgi:hypothetical protein